ncbi:MAG: aromatic-ring-hydroxylating dioxygenase subunit beta [Kordiimonas sp.]
MHNASSVSREDMLLIENFLYQEAQYLDDGDLENWMSLYSEDGVYWMPASPDQTCPLTEISILYEDKLLMDIRRRNLGHPLAPSMEYPVRGSRILGNVHLAADQPGGDAIRIASKFHAQLYYREEVTHFAGRYSHDLVREENSFKIVHKRVDLINADGVQRNLLIYI